VLAESRPSPFSSSPSGGAVFVYSTRTATDFPAVGNIVAFSSIVPWLGCVRYCLQRVNEMNRPVKEVSRRLPGPIVNGQFPIHPELGTALIQVMSFRIIHHVVRFQPHRQLSIPPRYTQRRLHDHDDDCSNLHPDRATCPPLCRH
jgi:hypothetical protein